MRIGRLDAAVGLAAAVAGAVAAALQVDGPWAIAGGALLGASLGVLRGAPRLGFGLAVAGTALAGAEGSIPDGPMLLLLVASFGIGLYAGRVEGVVAVAALFVADLTHALSADDWVPSVMFPVVFWAAGRALRAHEVVARRLKERAAELAEEREAYAQLSVRYERARIAAELHDIVAHSVSVMVIQASAARRSLAARPAEAAAMLENVERTGRQTMDELRQVLGVLRDQTGGVQAVPLPTLDDLPALVESAGGLPVRLAVTGVPERVPAGVAVSGYRIVQEALTNANRHAGPGATVDVRVTCSASDVEILVIDDGRGASTSHSSSTGYGLVGMQERATAAGGTFHSGPRRGGGWRVSATIPLQTSTRATATVAAAADGAATLVS